MAQQKNTSLISKRDNMFPGHKNLPTIRDVLGTTAAQGVPLERRSVPSPGSAEPKVLLALAQHKALMLQSEMIC